MDERLNKKVASTGRESRAQSDEARVNTDGTSTTMEQRRQALRTEWAANVLPEPPAIPGYHMCWLSTTNQSDPIYRRIQMGYEPVKVEEAPGLKYLRISGGDFEGCVSVNEMILFKIPEELYQEIMTINHYERPLEEEEVLKANTVLDQRDNDGKELGSREGFETLARKTSRPHFN